MNATFIAAVLLLATIPHSPIVTDRIDLIEVNHVLDGMGCLVFDQVIFWEWSQHKGRHDVQAWRLLKCPGQFPRRDYRTGDYAATWDDEETHREVRAATFRESWTQWDPELLERGRLAKERRKELGKW